MEAVKTKGDEAVKAFTAKFDQAELDEIAVPQKAFKQAIERVSDDLKAAILVAKNNIEKFHESQKESIRKIETMPGVVCWRKSVPISRVGLYIPGGTAPLFSTLLMLGIPAQIVGCEQLVLCTPPDKNGNINPAILYTAHLLGINQVYRVGGAQAIAAMTYGTATIPKVFKIFGPGNQYVTLAKQLASAEGMAIDMPAGPSEVAVVADESASLVFVAADLLSQAEHGHDSQVLLITTSEKMIQEILAEINQQLASLPRAETARQALANSKAILLSTKEEHLILAVEDDEIMAEEIKNAGSVFLGHYTPESAGDYASGTNHTLPTNGFATAYSGVSLDSFVKKITFQKISPSGIQQLGPIVEIMAEAEQLVGHKRAVTVRLDSLKPREND
ncbi:UNVERIFIED_CONTAM: hypothetical protein GTU68_003697 [Idotea baltica]|nr:hypothetical protein [Idotea baltica]